MDRSKPWMMPPMYNDPAPPPRAAGATPSAPRAGPTGRPGAGPVVPLGPDRDREFYRRGPHQRPLDVEDHDEPDPGAGADG